MQIASLTVALEINISFGLLILFLPLALKSVSGGGRELLSMG